MNYAMESVTEYVGRTTRQEKDFGFNTCMGRHAEKRVYPSKLAPGRAKQEEELANDDEISAMRGACGTLQSVAREGRPVASGEVSILSVKLPTPKVTDLTKVTTLVNHLKSTKVSFRIKSIPAVDFRVVMYEDASER